MTDGDTHRTGPLENANHQTASRRSVLRAASTVGGMSAITALAGCLGGSAGDDPEVGQDSSGDASSSTPSKPPFPLTLSISGPYFFYENDNDNQPIWYVDLVFELAGDIDDWQRSGSQSMAKEYMIRVSEDGGNPRPARIVYIDPDEGWYRIEEGRRVKKANFVADGTETEHLVFGRWERERPEPGTEYTVYLEANQNFEELESFTYEGDPTEKSFAENAF